MGIADFRVPLNPIMAPLRLFFKFREYDSGEDTEITEKDGEHGEHGERKYDD